MLLKDLAQGSRDGHVELATGQGCLGIVDGRGVWNDDEIEFEALHLVDGGDVDAGLEFERSILDSAGREVVR